MGTLLAGGGPVARVCGRGGAGQGAQRELRGLHAARLCQLKEMGLCSQAEFPSRVFVGAVEQDKERNESCVDSTLPDFANVRVVAIPHTASKGPTYGRFLAGTLYRGEAFYMQLDSHTQLAPKWDSRLIAMLDTCDSPKPVRPHRQGGQNAMSEQRTEGIAISTKR